MIAKYSLNALHCSYISLILILLFVKLCGLSESAGFIILFMIFLFSSCVFAVHFYSNYFF